MSAERPSNYKITLDVQKKIREFEPGDVQALPAIPLVFSKELSRFITLREVVIALQESSLSNIGSILGLAESTGRRIGKIAIELLREYLPIDFQGFSLNEASRKELATMRSEQRNYDVFLKLKDSEQYKEAIPILKTIEVSVRDEGGSGPSPVNLMEFLRYYFGWEVDKVEVKELASWLNRSQRRVAAMAHAGLYFLNQNFETNFKPWPQSIDIDHYFRMFNVVFNDHMLAYYYLNNYEKELLPVERAVLKLFLENFSAARIQSHLQEMQEKSPDMLIATPVSADYFLRKVLQRSDHKNPFMRVRAAKKASDILSSKKRLTEDAENI